MFMLLLMNCAAVMTPVYSTEETLITLERQMEILSKAKADQMKGKSIHYRYGEPVKDLRKAIENYKKLLISDKNLVCENGTWFVKHIVGSGKHKIPIVRKVLMQGIGKMNCTYVFVRDENGEWYKFTDRVNDAFKQYVSKLPLIYDSKHFMCDGNNWYVCDKMKEWRKIVWFNRLIENVTVDVLSEDGVWYHFDKVPYLERMKRYFVQLKKPAPIDETLKIQAENKQAKIKNENFKDEFDQDENNDFAPPTYLLRRALVRCKFMPPVDDLMTEKNGIVFVPDSDKQLRRINLLGIGGFKKHVKGESMWAFYNLVHTDDRKWHRVETVRENLKQILCDLPVQYDFGAVCCDGIEWYIRNKIGEYRKVVMRGDIEQTRMFAMTDDGTWAHITRRPYLEPFITYLVDIPRSNKPMKRPYMSQYTGLPGRG